MEDFFGFSDIGPAKNNFKTIFLMPWALKIRQFQNMKQHLDRISAATWLTKVSFSFVFSPGWKTAARCTALSTWSHCTFSTKIQVRTAVNGRDVIVCIVNGLWAGRPRNFGSISGRGNKCFSTITCPAWPFEPTQSPLKGVTDAFFWG